MNCIFCAIASGNAPGHILWQDKDVLVILSLEGHPLVMPRRHLVSLDTLDDATGAAMMQTAIKVAQALRNETSCEGVNLILSDGPVAGQDVFHLHLHVKPRWKGDGVVLSWDTETAPNSKRNQLAVALTGAMVALKS
jgi:histidine triad (HIT) family protein